MIIPNYNNVVNVWSMTFPPRKHYTAKKKYGGQLLLHQVQQYKGDPHCSAINSLLLCITPVDVTHERSEITPIK